MTRLLSRFSVSSILRFVENCYDPHSGTYASVPGGATSLYATCYGLLVPFYLGGNGPNDDRTLDFVLGCQDPESGYFVGPELDTWQPKAMAKHDFEHILLHLTCTVLPVLLEFDRAPRYPLAFAHRFVESDFLRNWLNLRDMRDAWLEGNNLLFVGQLLVYLRDNEEVSGASDALSVYFEWLDATVDAKTGLWGTDGQCSTFNAMCGAYHQLLVYYFEERPVLFRERLIDATLSLQHPDGGFSPSGGGGACEDVDAIDILVNMYKQVDYRRPAIRSALRRSLEHLLSLQNEDGGFPYSKRGAFSHMGIPATQSSAGASNLFSTWFRVHTIALLAEILTDETVLQKEVFRFNSTLSMGWHRGWSKSEHQITTQERRREHPMIYRYQAHRVGWYGRQLLKRTKRRLLQSTRLKGERRR